MKDNVRLDHTSGGASITVDSGAFRMSKPYATMPAAAREAVKLGLISKNQEVLLKGNSTGMPSGLSTVAEEIRPARLFESGFRLSL